MKIGTLNIKKAYLGTVELTPDNAYLGTIPLIEPTQDNVETLE